MKRTILLLMAIVSALFINLAVVFASPQIITATGEYIMGDNDSPKIAKDAARQEAMRSATEQAGVYVESYSRTQNLQVTEDDVKIIAGAVLKVLDEEEHPSLVNGVWKYSITIRAEVDTDNIDLKAMLEKRAELEKLQQERDDLKRQNEALLAQYKKSQGAEKQQIGRRLEDQYTLGDIFDKCVNFIQRGEQHRAINMLGGVISDNKVTDSPLAYAYYLRGRAYYELNSDNRALEDFLRAQNTPHDNSIYPVWRTHYYRGRIYYSQQSYRAAYKELKLAYEASGNADGEIREWLDRAYDKAYGDNSESRRDEREKMENKRWGSILGAVLGGVFKHG